jgi:nucleoside 2-deoxyribosyltransferase
MKEAIPFLEAARGWEKLVYVAGPYWAKDFNGIDSNIRQAEGAAIQLWNLGFAVLCLHLNSAHFEVKTKVPERAFREMGIRLVAACDAVLALEGWEGSLGTQAELTKARAFNIPVFFSINDLVRELTLAGLEHL